MYKKMYKHLILYKLDEEFGPVVFKLIRKHI